MVKMTGEHVYNLIQLGINPEVTFIQDCLIESISLPIYKGMKATLRNCIAGELRYLGVFDLSPYTLLNEGIEKSRHKLETEVIAEDLSAFEIKKGIRLCFFSKDELKFTLDTDDKFLATYYSKKPELFSMQYLDSCIKHCHC
jgi:hypothetical protein